MTAQVIPFPGAFKSPSDRRIDMRVKRMEALMAGPENLPDAQPAEIRMAQLLRDRVARKRAATPVS